MIEGSGSRPLTNGSWSGRAKSIRILWIRIHNIAYSKQFPLPTGLIVTPRAIQGFLTSGFLRVHWNWSGLYQCYGSRIWYLFDLWIRDPGWVKKLRSGSGMQIRDEHLGSSFRELRNNFLGQKYLNSLMWIRIRDPESGINIPDPQHWPLHSPWTDP